MTMQKRSRLSPLSLAGVKVRGGFWGPRIRINRQVTLPTEYRQLVETGRIEAIRLSWKPGDPNPPHHFWDSDIAKWIEAAAYSLASHPDAELEALVDGVVDAYAAAQADDGYLNSYYRAVEPEKRWTNLRDMHELYCAGHLMEAAVAYAQASGKTRMLEILCRYADHIDREFGDHPGATQGFPGHEEIELALVKLYRATGEARYMRLAQALLDRRGQQPHYYDAEARARGEDPTQWHGRGYDYNQSHFPVRQQSTAEGHAVRAMYLYCGMADVAAETGDCSLLEACRRLWQNVTRRRMYLTGGIGSAGTGERFTYDYDLPSDLAYAETCAAVGLVFWAHRMLQIEAHGSYADVMERALYNGALGGISLDGRQFFYGNPLEVDPAAHQGRPDLYRAPAMSPRRQDWFGCACCPPNLARLLASLGQYAYSLGDEGLYVHLYVAGEAEATIHGQDVRLTVDTDYPWRGDVALVVDAPTGPEFTLALRIPGWCRAARAAVNGRPTDVHAASSDGYLRLTRTWRSGDRVDLALDMLIERMEGHPKVRHTAGRVALQRGPLVYCLEAVDNPQPLHDIMLADDTELVTKERPDLLGGVVTIEGEVTLRDDEDWGDELYRPGPSHRGKAWATWVPYHTWANREPGAMNVWVLRD